MANETAPRDPKPQEPSDPEQRQNDFFYHGTIVRLTPKKKSGMVRTSSGKDLSFSYDLVDMYGPVKSPRGLREGLVVGYDMSWTSGGLKVTKIKTYRRAEGHPVAANSPATDDTAETREENSDRQES